MSSAIPAIKPEGGDAVIITNSPSGQDIHYLFDNFGKTISGSLGRSMMVPPHIRNLIIHTEFPEMRILDRERDVHRVMSQSQTIEPSQSSGGRWHALADRVLRGHALEEAEALAILV